MRAALLLGATLAATPLAAQDLAGVRQLAQQGETDSARTALDRLLAITPATDSTYPELLFTAGGLAATTPTMRLAYQRLVVEHGRSQWADDALLRLAQIDYAVGDHAGAVAQVERLRADYPTSPLLGLAALWGARAWFARNNSAAACVLLADGQARAGPDLELRQQLAFYQARCGRGPAVAATPPAPAAPDTALREPPPTPAAATPGPGYQVQLAALGTRAAAEEIAAAARRAGFDAGVVEEGGYFKVRAGPWRVRDDAVRAIPALRQRFGGSPFLVRVP